LKIKGMQIGGEDIENMFMNMMSDKNKLKNHRFKRRSFHASLFGNELNIF
jgi:hypothetical protein